MSTKKKKMNSSDRRQSIINAARPLFAELGYQGASIRKIAKAAGVSEALLYQHFPSKEELYQEILRYGVDISVVFTDHMKGLKPGAESLATYIYVAFKLILTEVPQYEEAQHWHERLLFQSLIGDRAYAVTHFKHLLDNLKDLIELHMKAAQKAGDLVAPVQSPVNRFWFIHHLAMALNLCHLSGEPACQYEGSREDLLREAALFSLRGLGLTDKALKRCFKPDKLETFYRHMVE